jgi:hypothetical protein
MKKWPQLMARLYPSPWRRRYGAEFEALLEDRELKWRDVLDVFMGALKMQVSFWNARNITLVCGFAGLILATGGSFAIPNEYVSRAIMRVSFSGKTDPADQAGRISALISQALSRHSLSEIIQRRDLNLYMSDRERKPLEDVIEGMKDKGIKVDIRARSSESSTVTLSFAYDDPMVAQRTMSALITRMADAIFTAAKNSHDPTVAATLDLLDPASLPPAPSFPNRGLISFAGLAAGVVAGVGIAKMRSLRLARG